MLSHINISHAFYKRYQKTWLIILSISCKKSKTLPTAATQLQNNYATKLSLSDLNLTLKILPPNLILCFFGYPYHFHSKTVIWDWEIKVIHLL